MKKTFYCLRCQARFEGEHVPMQVVERTCPKCGSNSVRAETPISAAKQTGKPPAEA